MHLKQLEASDVKNLAADKIYERGLKYAEDESVQSLDYDPSSDHIEAKVCGSYRHQYFVQIHGSSGRLNSKCSCLYEGNPCKHIVAVLLTFIKDKQLYIRNHANKTKSQDSLRAKLEQASPSELVDLLMTYSQTSDEFRRALLLRFEGGSDVTMKALSKDIQAAFADFEDGEWDISDLQMTLHPIIASLAKVKGKTKSEITWLIADKSLEMLNEYGISDDEDLESLAIEQLELTVNLLSQDEGDFYKFQVLKRLVIHYLHGNCGVLDDIYHAIHQICKDKVICKRLIDEMEVSDLDWHGKPFSRAETVELLTALKEFLSENK